MLVLVGITQKDHVEAECSECGGSLSDSETDICFDCEFGDDPFADSLGIPPELLEGTPGCCDRPRAGILPCGHCACRGERGCGDCPGDPIWKCFVGWDRIPESWCGCDAPGKEVLQCGHCACGEGLCVEFVYVGKGRPFEKRRKAACA